MNCKEEDEGAEEAEEGGVRAMAPFQEDFEAPKEYEYVHPTNPIIKGESFPCVGSFFSDARTINAATAMLIGAATFDSIPSVYARHRNCAPKYCVGKRTTTSRGRVLGTETVCSVVPRTSTSVVTSSCNRYATPTH